MNRYRITAVVLLLGVLMTACSGQSAAPTGSPAAPTAAATTPANGTSVGQATPTGAVVDQPTHPAPTAAATLQVTETAQTGFETPTSAEPTQASPTETTAAAPGSGVPTDTVQSFPDPAGYTWVQVVSGIFKPTDMAFLPDNTGRFIILSQTGKITLFQNNQALPDLFLDISGRVGSGGNEQGLLGIALHPQFQQNGYFYVNYTGKDGNTVIARFNLLADNPNRADPDSEKVLLRVDQPFANHNGGSMAFGPDGFLYMGLGDGGSADDPHGNGQRLDTYLGKVLRIDVNQGDPYTVPDTNPFAKGGGNAEIWAYGLRNPWRFSFDRLTGDFYIADVGQNEWEEVDYLPANAPGGANFGWNFREGKHAFRGSPPANANLVEPVFDYSHGEGCSISGGYVYRGQALPELRGVYMMADYCSGRIWGLLRDAGGAWQGQELFRDRWNITAFGQDPNGELYFLDQASGGAWKLQKK